VLGTVNLPIVHYSVKKWGGNHPTVITEGGGGLAPDMKTALMLGFIAMTLLVGLLLWSRARLARSESRLAALQERAAADGLEEAA
jgi:heme exporter protein C